jgi:hypothetical protein
MGSGDDCTVAIIYRPDSLKKSEEIEQSKEFETTTIETPPSKETSQAIAALTDSEAVAPENMEDVTVTITIKKDKNKTSESSSVTLAETDSASSKQKNSSENKTDEKENAPLS